ncbi:MAG: iron-sulfur cluster carrier protein MrpORP [Candidatus Eisenbacteria bacterium]
MVSVAGDAATGRDFKERTQSHEERKLRIEERMAQVKHKFIVISGKGGVGKSTVAAYVAASLAADGNSVGLLDTDIHGPSIPKMLGLEDSRVTAAGETIMPIPFSKNLSVMSIGFLLRSSKDAVIWRGPMKMGIIEEFLGNVEWGPLDYMIIDSPPGTGDEPLSVCQLIPGLDGAIVIATPQEIALVDVEKSISFCRQLNIPVFGVIENMSGFICPHCGEKADIFKSGGAEALAAEAGVPFLGRIPIVPEVVDACDAGACSLASIASDPFKQSLKAITDSILKAAPATSGPEVPEPAAEPDNDAGKTLPAGHEASHLEGAAVQRIALPLDGDRLSTHFGHSTRFAIYYVEGSKIIGQRDLTPPPHAPGVIPSWLKEQGVGVVIAGGLGGRAIAAFESSGITVVCGAPPEDPKDVVSAYLKGTLAAGENICDH